MEIPTVIYRYFESQFICLKHTIDRSRTIYYLLHKIIVTNHEFLYIYANIYFTNIYLFIYFSCNHKVLL